MLIAFIMIGLERRSH